ncbi:hypothetical protein D3C78_1688470 [compost metagenome]
MVCAMSGSPVMRGNGDLERPMLVAQSMWANHPRSDSGSPIQAISQSSTAATLCSRMSMLPRRASPQHRDTCFGVKLLFSSQSRVLDRIAGQGSPLSAKTSS